MNEFCKEKGFVAWFETSAKENINIDDAARTLVDQVLLNDKLINEANKDSGQFSLTNNFQATKKSTCLC